MPLKLFQPAQLLTARIGAAIGGLSTLLLMWHTSDDIMYRLGWMCVATGGAGVIGAKSRLPIDDWVKLGVATLIVTTLNPLVIILVEIGCVGFLLFQIAGAFLAPSAAIAVAISRVFQAGNPWLTFSAVTALAGAAIVNWYFVGFVYAGC